MSESQYGVLAYIPGPGAPYEDEAHFDGWYSTRELADEVFALFVEDYPSALVHVVERHKSEWRKWANGPR